jgi:hypothetical protein
MAQETEHRRGGNRFNHFGVRSKMGTVEQNFRLYMVIVHRTGTD